MCPKNSILEAEHVRIYAQSPSDAAANTDYLQLLEGLGKPGAHGLIFKSVSVATDRQLVGDIFRPSLHKLAGAGLLRERAALRSPAPLGGRRRLCGFWLGSERVLSCFEAPPTKLHGKLSRQFHFIAHLSSVYWRNEHISTV